jgi:hypothetical protein
MYQQNVGASFKIVTNDVAGTFPESDRANMYLLIAMDFTKWPEVYAIPNKQASTVADQLLHLRRPDGAAQRPRPELRIQTIAEGPGVTRVRKTRETHTPVVRWNGGMLY